MPTELQKQLMVFHYLQVAHNFANHRLMILHDQVLSLIQHAQCFHFHKQPHYNIGQYYWQKTD